MSERVSAHPGLCSHQFSFLIFQLSNLFFGHTEEVCQFVDNGFADLSGELLFGAGDGEQVLSIQDNLIGTVGSVYAASIKRHAVK